VPNSKTEADEADGDEGDEQEIEVDKAKLVDMEG
jgi:hypothetical protein